MLFLNNKRAWIICIISVLAAAAGYFILHVETDIFAFPGVQLGILLLSSTDSVKNWCMNYKISVMRSENQYYMMIFFGVLLMFFLEGGYLLQSIRGI